MTFTLKVADKPDRGAGDDMTFTAGELIEVMGIERVDEPSGP